MVHMVASLGSLFNLKTNQYSWNRILITLLITKRNLEDQPTMVCLKMLQMILWTLRTQTMLT
jgi:hypothetical protein